MRRGSFFANSYLVLIALLFLSPINLSLAETAYDHQRLDVFSITADDFDTDIDGAAQAPLSERELERHQKYLEINRMLYKDIAYIYIVDFPKNVVVNAPKNSWLWLTGVFKGAWHLIVDIFKLAADVAMVPVIKVAELNDAQWIEFWQPTSPLLQAIAEQGAMPVVKQVPRGLYEGTVGNLLSGDPQLAGEATFNIGLLVAPVPKGIQSLKTIRPVSVAELGQIMSGGTATMAEAFAIEGELAGAMVAAGTTGGSALLLSTPSFDSVAEDSLKNEHYAVAEETAETATTTSVGGLDRLSNTLSDLRTRTARIEGKCQSLTDKWTKLDDLQSGFSRQLEQLREKVAELTRAQKEKNWDKRRWQEIRQAEAEMAKLEQRLASGNERIEAILEKLEVAELKHAKLSKEVARARLVEGEKVVSIVNGSAEWKGITFGKLEDTIISLEQKAGLLDEVGKYSEAAAIRSDLAQLRTVVKNMKAHLKKIKVDQLEEGLQEVAGAAYGRNAANGELTRFLGASGCRLNRIGFRIVSKGGNHPGKLMAPIFDKMGAIIGEQQLTVIPSRLVHPGTADGITRTIRAALGKIGVRRFESYIPHSSAVEHYQPIGHTLPKAAK